MARLGLQGLRKVEDSFEIVSVGGFRVLGSGLGCEGFWCLRRVLAIEGSTVFAARP